MTREEAINKLIRIRQLQGGESEAHEALGMAIDVLAYQAELSEGLEEAAEEYARLDDEGVWKDGGKYKGFIAGAEWGMNQMPLPEDTTIFQKGIAEGKRLMMEGAVDGKVINSYNPVTAVGQPTLHGIELVYPDKDKSYLVAGDTVKIVVIPEEK